MKRTTILKLLLSVLALVAVAQARAADLKNDIGATYNGTGTWHFVHNQVGFFRLRGRSQ